MVATLLLTAPSCARRVRIPDLAEQYARSAPVHWPDLNPVIVIPGALGTRLTETGTDRSVWGAFGGGYASPRAYPSR